MAITNRRDALLKELLVFGSAWDCWGFSKEQNYKVSTVCKLYLVCWHTLLVAMLLTSLLSDVLHVLSQENICWIDATFSHSLAAPLQPNNLVENLSNYLGDCSLRIVVTCRHLTRNAIVECWRVRWTNNYHKSGYMVVKHAHHPRTTLLCERRAESGEQRAQIWRAKSVDKLKIANSTN